MGERYYTICVNLIIAGWCNGRTPGFGPGNLGPIPSPAEWKIRSI